MPLYPKMLRTKEHTSIPSPSDVFIFGLTVESIKELQGALGSLPFQNGQFHYAFFYDL
jgi:hypothetical protein